MLKTAHKINIIKASAFLLCCGFIAALLTIAVTTKETTPPQIETKKISYNDKYEGFKKDTKISKISIPQNGEIHELTTIVQENTKPSYVLSPREQEKKKYEVQYHIKNTDNKYVDISFLIDRDNKTLKTTITGLHHNEKFSLKLNKQNILNNISADWAGKIEFKNTLMDKNNAIKICSFISKENQNLQSICHQTGMRGDRA